MLAWLPSAFGWNAVLVKFLTMACQFAWGYPLCKEVIFSLNLQACQSGWHPMTAPYV